MAEEIVASPTAFANGENDADDKEFAVAVEKEETFDRDAPASGDRDLAIERLIQECLSFKEWYLDYELKLSDTKANPALEARRKELELEEARFLAELEESRRRSDAINDLFEKVDRLVNEYHLNEELRVSEQKAQNIDNAAPAEEEELRSQLVVVEEKTLQNRDMQGGVSGSLMQALALGIASAVGVVAGTLGTLVCLYVAKRK